MIVYIHLSELFVSWQTEEDSTGSAMLGLHLEDDTLEMLLSSVSPHFQNKTKKLWMRFCVILKTHINTSSSLLFIQNMSEMSDLYTDELL